MLAMGLCLLVCHGTYKFMTMKTCPIKIDLNDLRAMTDVNSAIFFLETDPSLDNFSIVSECAFESAALRNPHRDIVVLLNDSSRISRCGSHLKVYLNLDVYKVDFKSLTKGTVLEVFVKPGTHQQQR